MPRIETFNRDHVLQNAMKVFWDRGYNATSMQDLVDATGLNRSSIYNSFGGKMKLYRAALDRYIQETNEHFIPIVNSDKNPLEKIQTIFESFLPEIYNDSRGCMSMNCKSEMSSNVDLRKWLEITQEETIKMFQRLIQEGQDLGIINNLQSSRSYAWYVFNAFQGFRMTGILEKDTTVLKSIINNSLNILR